jgi:hypothetical protein
LHGSGTQPVVGWCVYGAQANFEADALQDWADWDWNMNFPEFVEAWDGVAFPVPRAVPSLAAPCAAVQCAIALSDNTSVGYRVVRDTMSAEPCLGAPLGRSLRVRFFGLCGGN